MELSVTGNSEYFISPFYSDKKIEFVSYLINGDFDADYIRKNFCFKRNDVLLKEYNWNDLYNFSYEIRGYPFEKTIDLLKQKNYTDYFAGHNFLTYQEIGIIKALFNSLLILEYSLSTGNIEEIKKNIYDNFILDMTNELGVQRDIYFIPENIHDDESIKNEINLLIEINLLCKINIIYNDYNLTSYFLPFIKPGIDFANIKQYDKNMLIKSNKLYKKFLNMRNSCLNNFVNKK